jgi:hypothetical protein
LIDRYVSYYREGVQLVARLYITLKAGCMPFWTTAIGRDAIKAMTTRRMKTVQSTNKSPF